jgi:hypothetical protein
MPPSKAAARANSRSYAGLLSDGLTPDKQVVDEDIALIEKAWVKLDLDYPSKHSDLGTRITFSARSSDMEWWNKDFRPYDR